MGQIAIGQERRQYKRVDTDFDVRCYIGERSSIDMLVGSVNLSEGGIRIRAPREFLVGSQLDLVFYLPNSTTRRKLQEMAAMHLIPKDKNYGKDRFEFEAEVVWSGHSVIKPDWYDTGLRFMFADLKQLMLIREYIDRHAWGAI